MRIVIVTPWYPTIAAPTAGIFVRRDAELIARKHDVEVIHLVSPDLISPADLSADKSATIPVHRIPMSRRNPLSPLRAWTKVAHHLASADVLHSHAFQALLPFAFRRVNIPWVHSEHWSGVANSSSFSLPGRIAFALSARLLRRPDVATAVSSFLREKLRPYRSGTTLIVPSVVAQTAPTRVTHSADELRLVTVANLVEGKDPGLAVQTIRELRRRKVNATLRWVGDGPLRQTIASQLTNDDGITLVGSLDRAGVSTELSAAEIFLLPTRSETLCLSAIEAIAHGRPVVIGAHGGQRDYVSEDNGILVHERTAHAYADAILKVRDSFEILTPDRVAQTLDDRFTPDRVLEQYENAYRVACETYEKKGTDD